MKDRLENYDRENDVLYISNTKNKPCISSEPIDGVVIRRDKTSKIIGVTIFDVGKAIVLNCKEIKGGNYERIKS